MTNVPDDELISAYLDGELSGEELLRAEQLLATQPESRQLLEELTALRASLQGLPRQSLERGFADRVLRRAEREMLQPTQTASQTPIAPRNDDHPPRLSWRRWQRPLIWSTLAVAASLVVMMVSPDRKEVAIAPAPPGGELNAGGAPAVPALAKHEATEATPKPMAAPVDAPQAAPAPPSQVARDVRAVGAMRSDAAAPQADASLFDTGNDHLLVVECDVASAAVAEADLRGLLMANQIAWEPTETKAKSTAHDKDAVALQTATADKQEAPEQKDTAADSTSDAVYVLANTEQLQTAINSLSASETFRNVRFNRIAAPPEALVTYDQSPDVPTAQAAPKPVETSAAAANGKPSPERQSNEQSQLNRARQVPFAAAQSTFGVPDVASTASSGATAQDAKAIPQARALRQAQLKQMPVTPSTPAEPAAPADVPSVQRQSQSGNTTRALIILHVAPEASSPEIPPDAPK
jgi:anti-sigma factor RsiW